MPLSTEFSDEGAGVFLIASGIFTGQDLVASKLEIMEAATRGMPISYGFVDLSNIDRFSVDKDDIQDTALADEKIAKIVGKIKVAILAPTDIAFGMARMWQAYVDQIGWETYVFRDRTTAEAWLEANAHDFHTSASS